MLKEELSESYGIIGLGRFGTALAEKLAEAGREVIVVDRNENKVKELRNYTDFASGGYASTESPLDFALNSSGFFCIQSGNGTVYTRNGSFSLDDGGYLCLQGVGRVLGQNGPIYLGTDKIVSDSLGNLYTENGNTFLGRLSIVDFQNYDDNLTKGTGDVFTANGQGTAVNGSVVQKALESSNVEPVDEMARMMASERSLQSSAQVLKIYDQLIGKAVTQLGPV